MTLSPDFTLCSSCGGLNAPDSKFCRHCGQTLEGARVVGAPESAAASTSAASASIAPAESVTEAQGTPPAVASNTSSEAIEVADERSSPAEIDARRARQLLERAHSLADRNDIAGAVLACRQAIALTPSVGGGQAMLGALLERAGDLTHALQAFEKASQLAPDSGATRDVERLRAKMGGQPNAPVFHFDDTELFGEDDTLLPTYSAPVETVDAPPQVESVSPTSTPAETSEPLASVATAPEGAAQSVSEVAVVTPVEGAPVEAAVPLIPIEVALSQPQTNPAAANLVSDGAPMNIAAALPPIRERRNTTVPVRVERRVTTNPNVKPLGSPLSTPVGARVQAPIGIARVAHPLPQPVVNPQTQGWSSLWARPSYFGRSLPLVGATILSLGFLGWARGLADARDLSSAPPPPTVVDAPQPPDSTSDSPSTSVAPPANSPGSSLPPLSPVGGASVPGGGFPITNQTLGSQSPNSIAAPPVATRGNASNNGGSRVAAAPVRRTPIFNAGGTARNAQRSATRSPQLLAPAPIPFPGASQNPTSSGFTLPAPVIAAPAPAVPATSVLRSGSGEALNPAGSNARGYVRITQGRVGSILPSRPAARAGDAERAAAAAARGGSTGQAIDGLTSAINANSGDAAFRFQQRAQLFLGQGDYARAADDFQAAIAAYNEQINRGDQVASARAGLRAARSGLNVALAGGR